MIYNTIHHDIRNKAGLSLVDYCLLDSIYQLSRSPKSRYKTWCNAPKSYFKYLASGRTVLTRLNHLEVKGWIEFKEGSRMLKRTTKKYFNEVQSYILGTKKLHHEETAPTKKLRTTYEETAYLDTKKLRSKYEETAPNNNNKDINKNKDSDIATAQDKIKELESQLEAIKKKKEIESIYNPCLTSATGGVEVNVRWPKIQDLQKAYEKSRGFKTDINLVEAGKKSFIEKGFNYNRGVNTFAKLEDCVFRWIDNQKKGLNKSQQITSHYTPAKKISNA